MIVFKLNFSSVGSWNGVFSGEDDLYVRVRDFSDKGFKEELVKNSPYNYSWDDGWEATIEVFENSHGEAQELTEKSSGFMGYDWMIDSIISHGKILTEEERKEIEKRDHGMGILKEFNVPVVCEMWGIKKVVARSQEEADEQVLANNKELPEEMYYLDGSMGIDKESAFYGEVKHVKVDLEFEDELIDILDVYSEKGWRDEPLDGDEIDGLIEHLKNQLNLINGNMTWKEYENTFK